MKDASRSVPTVAALLSDDQRPKLLADVQADYDALRTRHAAKHDRPILPLERARANRTPVDWDGYTPHEAAAPRRRGVRRLRHRRAARVHRLAAVLQRVGDEGQVPRHPQQPGVGRDRPQALRRRPGDARPDHRREVADRPRRLRVLPGERRRRRHRALHGRGAHRGAAPPCTTCASRGSTARASPTGRSATSSRPRETGLADHVGRLRGDRRDRRRGADRAVQGRARRLLRDPAGVAGRPARRGLRRAAARAGAQGVLGLRGRRGASTTSR